MAWQENTRMHRRTRLPVPRALKMPLRDILRGVVTIADMTEEVLEPATVLLPKSVQSSFRSALAAVEGAGSNAVTPTIDHADIVKASAFLRGLDTSRAAMETFVSVLAFVWERALSKSTGQHHLLFSETVAAAGLTLKSGGDTETSYARAAAILMALRETNVASRLPGMPMTPSEVERGRIDQTLLAGCAWLLSERAQDFTEEERLLDLALALIQALESEAAAGFTDQDLLAEKIQSFAEHL